MQVSAELSLYPLTADYEPPIIDFIRRLRKQPGIVVATNALSTQVTGDYAAVMTAITAASEPTMAAGHSCSLVIKLLNVAIEPGSKVTV